LKYFGNGIAFAKEAEPPMAAVRDFFWALCGLAMIAILFFGTLFVLQYFGSRMAFADEAESLMTALQDYRREFGAYPVRPVPDISTIEAKQVLAKAGHPARNSDLEDPDARYVSFDGKSYGLLFHLGPRYNYLPVNSCIIEVDVTNTGWWGQFSKCRF
jgi:hypothetical protein